MRIEITPVYRMNTDSYGTAIVGTKELVSVRKRIYPEDDSMFAEWLLDWATGEWRPSIDMPWNVEINAETRARLGWKEPDA